MSLDLAARPQLAEVHAFERLGRHVLFDVASMTFYEVSPIVHHVVEALAAPDARAFRELAGRYRRRDLAAVLAELRQAGVLDRPSPSPARAAAPRPRPAQIRTLELMVTHGCNLRCRYCYGADPRPGWESAPHLFGSRASAMPWEVAKLGVDFLLGASGSHRNLGLVFFGGEPLLELPLIRRVTAYVRDREAASGKRVQLSLSTNGTLLDAAAVDFLVANRIGCQVSIDGPAPVQDANRATADGRGSYAALLPGVRRLIAARPGRVPARVTVASGPVDVPAIVDHLLGLGFGSVHVEPALGGCGAARLSDDEIVALERQTEAVAEKLVGSVLSDRIFDFTNLVRFVRATRVVEERLHHHCGAGRGYLALARDGSFYPCHRFVGMAEYRLGDLAHGLAAAPRRRFTELTVGARPGCSACWARHLCGGGCWKHAVDAHGGLERPDERASCRLIRHQIECAMSINAALAVDDQAILGSAART
ncbi:MAG: SPASM domain-containing protein [Deltaproteobacteria bacterium]|nr:SPASM domain-containing protein [Deltaproteobacteria bacterium]